MYLLQSLYNFTYVSISLRGSSMLQRSGKSEAQAKEGKGCHVVSSISSAFMPNVVRARAKRGDLQGHCRVSFPRCTQGGTEHGQN